MVKIFISIIYIFLFLSNNSLAEKIVYLDVDYLLMNSNKGKIILRNLDEINLENIKKLEKKEKLLKEEEVKIIQQKNILNIEKYNEKVKNFKIKIEEHRKEKDSLVSAFNKRKETEINNFISMVDKILSEYVQNNSIDLVLNKKDILMGKNNYNITNNIMDIINNSID